MSYVFLFLGEEKLGRLWIHVWKGMFFTQDMYEKRNEDSNRPVVLVEIELKKSCSKLSQNNPNIQSQTKKVYCSCSCLIYIHTF